MLIFNGSCGAYAILVAFLRVFLQTRMLHEFQPTPTFVQ